MNLDRIAASFQRGVGTVLVRVGAVAGHESLIAQGRAMRARAGVRAAIGSAKLALRACAR